MRQEIEKEIEKLKNTHFNKIYKTKRLTIDKQTEAGEVYINLNIEFHLEQHKTFFYCSYYFNGKEIETNYYWFDSYQVALLIFQKIKKMIKTFISNL